MNLVDIVAILAVLQYIWFGILVGGARGRYGIKAPAVSGSEPFERIYRVQMNTLEVLVPLLAALYVSARYFPSMWIAGAGAVYIVGRFIYWRSYVAAPEQRTLGFFLTMLPIMAMAIGSLVAAALGRGMV